VEVLVWPQETAMDNDEPDAYSEPLLDLLNGVGDSAFAIDRDGHVVGWNLDAERRFGLRANKFLGQPCNAVFGCRDLQGRPLHASGCLLPRSIPGGRPPLTTDILVRQRSGQTLVVSKSQIMLPESRGGRTVVLLRPAVGGLVDPVPGPAPSPASAPLRLPGRSSLDLGAVLDRVLSVTGADAAELFLAAPGGGYLALAAHRGRAPRAFREITQFEVGQGFPGIVASTGEPLLALDLPDDDRYLRSAVKREGFRFYLCVPVWGGSGLLGSLHVAARRRPDPTVLPSPWLAAAARELGRAVESTRLQAARSIHSYLLDGNLDAGANFRAATDRALQAMVDVAEGDCGVLLLLDREAALRPASEWRLAPRLRRLLARPACPTTACPAIARGRCLVRGKGMAVDEPFCRSVFSDLATSLCLPLSAGGRPLGVVLIGYDHSEVLPTRHLSLLHGAIDALAVTIHNAGVALRQEAAARMLGAANIGAWAQPSPARLADETGGGPVVAQPAPLDIRCFGKFEISRDGRTIPAERFARRRSLTLLKILLTRFGKEVHREELIELLWPDEVPQAASTMLNVVVHYLRQALESHWPGEQPPAFVRRSGEYYYFDSKSPHRLDSQDFLSAIDLGARLKATGRSVEAIESYKRAIALYRGDFLEEERYSDWCSMTREYLRERFLALLRRAAELHLQQGDVDAAVGCYRRALQTDGTLEDVHRDLMAALWRAGRRDEALRQYRECCAWLERELGVGPMPETEALRKAIASE
jgi:DNA-binding SARP family transcriptional activator/GAF domain-containing protein